MGIKAQIHGWMGLHFGKDSCAASHKWLRGETGACHVRDLSPQRARKILGRLRSKPVAVRAETWRLLESERA